MRIALASGVGACLVALAAGCGSSNAKGDAASDADGQQLEEGGADVSSGTDGGAPDVAVDAGVEVAPAMSFGAHCSGCTKSRIGLPRWEPTGAIVMAGTVGSGTTDALEAWLSPLLAPKHTFQQGLNIIPAAVHAGPYDEEPYAMATAAGVTPKQMLTAAEYTAPMGAVALIVLVPTADADTGSSFDFASGPILPNPLFPLKLTGKVLRNGADYDTLVGAASYIGFDMLEPKVPGDGPSHYLIALGESTAAVTPPVPAPGSYELQYRLLDTGGAGWLIQVPFMVSQ